MDASGQSPTSGQAGLASVRQLQAAVSHINTARVLGDDRDLVFSSDPDTKRPIIEIVDRSTGEIVDEIPPQTVLQMLLHLGIPVEGVEE